MIGVSLPFSLFAQDTPALGHTKDILHALRMQGAASIELRTVRPDDAPQNVLRAARMLFDRGFGMTVHGTVRSAETAEADIFGPLADVLAFLSSPAYLRSYPAVPMHELLIVLHPIVGDNVHMLGSVAEKARTFPYPVRIALENNRLLPDGSEGDSVSLVLDAVSRVQAAGYPEVGICFDMGHYLYACKKDRQADSVQARFPLPPKAFLDRVIHTHIHGLRGLKTHFPLDPESTALLRPLTDALSCGYFGLYHLELDFPRFAGETEPDTALLSSVSALSEMLSYSAKLYDDLRVNFDRRFSAALRMYEEPSVTGTRFALIGSSSYLFRTGDYRWAMDLSFRNAYALAQTPNRVGALLSCLDMMLISHGHEDHFEERTVRQLADTEMVWVIPDFLERQALQYGIRPENMRLAHEGETLEMGPLHILPFPGRHYRPGTRNGVEEYGYRVSAAGEPTLLFPADTRDYAVENLPFPEPGDYCFAHIWLGDGNGLKDDFAEIGPAFADFMLRFSDRNILFAHMYENGRADRDMWRREHAELLSELIHGKSPRTVTWIPRPGEILTLSRTT